MDIAIKIDSAKEESLQKQLYEELRLAILERRLPPGHKLPATRELSKSLGVSRTTVVLTYEALTSEGYLAPSTGSGTYVACKLPEEFDEVRSAPEGESCGVAPHKRNTKAMLSPFGKYLYDYQLAGPAEEPEFNFGLGRPDSNEFPIRIWLNLLNKRTKNGEFTSLDLPKRSQGYLPLREAIAGYLSRSRAVNVSPDQIVIVSGSQQAIDLVSRVFIHAGDHIGIENPCWAGARSIFEAYGAQLHGFSVDFAGIVVDELRRPDTPPMKLIYVTPSHQFPTGVVMSLDRRLDLLCWARKNDTFLIEDDYDSEFRYTGRPIPALAGLAKDDSVIYMGTFSKTLFVSLRLGYLVVPPELVPTFTHAKWMSDRHSPILEQQVLTDFINEGHYERHIRRMRALYNDRRQSLISAMENFFGNEFEICGDNAGIHLLIRFKTKLSTEEILQRAQEHGVFLFEASYFDKPATSAFIMCYGNMTPEKIFEGVKRLKEALS